MTQRFELFGRSPIELINPGPSCSGADGDDELRKQVAGVRAAGLEVRCWGVGAVERGGEANLRRAAAAGAQGATVDWPVRARTMLASTSI